MSFLHFSPAEITAIRFEPEGRGLGRGDQPAARHPRGARAGARAVLGARGCSMSSSTCRWCCRPSSPATFSCCCSGATDRSGGSLPTSIGLVFAFRWTGAALASAVMGFPLMVRAIRLSVEAVDRRLEDAAGTLGASRDLGLSHGHPAAHPARHHRRRASWALRAAWASSAPPSPSSPTFPAKRRPCRRRSMSSPRCRAAMRARCG